MAGEFIIEAHTCICGRGTIEVTKKVYGAARSNKKRESYVGISPCPFCGRKIDNNGNDLSKLV